MPGRLGAALVTAALVLPLLLGCEDVRHFSGQWTGVVSSDPNLALGFPAGSAVNANIVEATRTRINMNVQLTADGAWLDLAPVRRAAADVLGEMQLPGDPLRNYLGVLSPAGAAPYFAVTSLFAEDRVELRLIRGAEDTYAVFSLHRADPSP